MWIEFMFQYLCSEPALCCADKQAGIPLTQSHCSVWHMAAKHLPDCVEDDDLEGGISR